MPALATTASVVVGPARSRLANLAPEASPVWYWKEPEAGAIRESIDCQNYNEMEVLLYPLGLGGWLAVHTAAGSAELAARSGELKSARASWMDNQWSVEVDRWSCMSELLGGA